ncbi:hypothetical protein FisN_28Hh050 [Fistulifera solaris]|uniref:Uncharacterized protein n=1 Tax=Fistulifera solaris TaxID=1519565 RepID=A0A1Z5KHR2_FISSO|nr:hypothetical protein FisN_28Hh050 [Fistulifera solaris]|eukprot:GAX25581.1 hypothetical protein FisN_28Hh050 [Fistulifera solaris]
MKLFAVLSLAVATSALEQPNGILQEYQRELQALNDFESQVAGRGRFLTDASAGKANMTDSSSAVGACQARKNMCEAATQGMEFPAQKWIDTLESMGSSPNNTLVDDLIQLIDWSQQADFNPVVSTVHSSASAQNVLTVLRDTAQEIKNVDQADPTGATAVMVDALTRVETVLVSVGAPVPEQSIDLVIFLLEFVAGLLGTLSGSPLEIVIYIVQQVFVFVTTFLAGLFTIAVFPSADPECQSELMFCNYMKMMLDVVPGLVGSIFIAETTTP